MISPQSHLRFAPARLPEETAELRADLRALLEREHRAGTWEDRGKSWNGHCPELSRKLGEAGFLGLTFPKQYGGHERTQLDRYVVTEELLAAGAPTAAHWVADRQSGPLILRFGSDEQKERFVPPIARGESCFCIGMSEPDSGSDLASLACRATRVDGGWSLSGTKIWTSNAHFADYCIVCCRTEAKDDGNRHAGLSQVIVDLKGSTGITVRPILNLGGLHEFNEVVFDDCFVPDDCLLGEPGDGWHQVTSELAYERSGPERFLTNFHVLRALVGVLSQSDRESTRRLVGSLLSRLWALRQASISVAGMLQAGELPNVEASLVKDVGTALQQELPEIARAVALDEQIDDVAFWEVVHHATMLAPAYSNQAGTTEILRGIIARGLRLR